MRKFNVKLFLILMAGVVVVGGALFGIHQLQYQRIARALLFQANRAEEQGQPERMARCLKDYLEFAPQDMAARKRLGLTWTSDDFASNPRTRRKGVELLNQVLIGDPNQPEVRRAIVRISLLPATQEPKMARDHLQILWQDAQKPDATLTGKELGELESFWGQLFEIEEKPIEALARYRQVREDNPEDSFNYVRIAALLRRQPESDSQQKQKNFQEADALIDDLVVRNPESYKSYLARWNYRREFNLLHDPGVPAHLQALVRRYAPAAAGELLTDRMAWTEVLVKQAATDVDKALERAPEELEVLLAAADMERLKGSLSRDPKVAESHRKQARAHLQQGLQLQTKQGYRNASDQAKFLLLWHLANLLLDSSQAGLARIDASAADEQQNLADSAESIAQMRQLHFVPPGTTDFLEGRLFRLQRRWADAVARFEQARPLFAKRGELTFEIDVQLGYCYEKLEEPGLELAAYERALKWDPSSPPARLGMGTALWAMGRREEAVKNYQTAMEYDQDTREGWLDIARLHVLVQLGKEERNWKDADAALEQAAKMFPNSVEVKLLKAEMLASQDNFEQADHDLRKWLDETPNDVKLWVALSGLAANAKNSNPQGAEEVLKAAQDQLGDVVDLRLARVRMAVRQMRVKNQKGSEKDLEVRKQQMQTVLAQMEQGWQKYKPAEQSKLLDGLAEAQFISGDTAKAKELWGKMAVLPQNQADLRLRLLLFDLAVMIGQKDGIDRALADIAAIEGEQGSYCRFGKALRLIWMAKQTEQDRPVRLNEARLLLDKVANSRPSWPRLSLARAEIEEMRRNPEEAIGYLKRAIEQGETSPVVIKRLVDALNQRQRYAEAAQETERLSKALLINSELGKLAVDTALRQGNTDKGLSLLEIAVDPNSKNFRDQLWQARMLFVANKDREAISKIQQAIALAPAEPEPYVALVQFMAARGRGEEAKTIVAEAREKLPPEKAPLALAQCYEALGMSTQAQQFYESAIKQNPSDVGVLRTAASFYLKTGRMNEVVPILRVVAERRVQTTPDNVEWARRGLAIVLSASMDCEQFKEALKLVGLRLDERGQLLRENQREDNTDSIRIKARVLATQSDQRQFRERAIELLEQLGRRVSLLPDDKYILAQLYDRGDNWVKAREQLDELCLAVSTHEQPRYLAEAPQYMNYYILGLLRGGDYRKAEGVLDKLDTLEKQRNVKKGAFGTIQLRAQLLEKTGQSDKALSLLRDYAASNRDQKNMVLVVIAGLARQQKYEEATALLDKEINTCTVESATAVYISLLNEMKPTDEQCVHVETWVMAQLQALEKQLSQAGEPTRVQELKRSILVVRHGLARLNDLRGRYPESEAVYRAILNDRQADVLALNNLSWLLAQRTGDGKAALELIDKAITNMGRRADLLDTRGLAFLSLGETDRALADFKEAAADERTPTRLFHLARAHFAAKDRATALKVMLDARTAGLDPSKLHPVEQLSCRQLLTDLKLQ